MPNTEAFCGGKYGYLLITGGNLLTKLKELNLLKNPRKKRAGKEGLVMERLTPGCYQVVWRWLGHVPR